MNRRTAALVAILTLAAPAATPSANDPERLLGFSEEESRRQLEWEARFDQLLERDHVRQWIQRLSARPHPVGSPYGKENAEWMAAMFRSWGYDTRIEEYRVLFPTPRTRRLELLAPRRFVATLEEPALAEDSTSNQKDEQLPSYNAYSIDGDVEGELVYVNYGVPEDYEELERLGISVAGRIVIARYGGSWRGIKPKVAAEHGAIGCILYSDPRDDGYFRGDVYPQGPFRNAHGVQRGSVSDMPTYPGDPLTPGRGATEDAERLERSEAPTLTRIPVLPISHADAQPLLEAMQGPVAPSSWRGALPLTYHLGPGPARVRLTLEFDWGLAPAYNVIARLEGSERPDQWIMRGNHHDAWVNGAQDPVSGMAALMEEARAVAELVKLGWRPRRSILYAGWDAEEPGLLGSTEWAEHHGPELREKLAVYVNSDSNGRGFLFAGGSHGLERLVNQVARAVTDPQTGVSVWKRWQARLIARTPVTEDPEARGQRDLPISALGSGSDYTPFLQHLGISSLNLSYGGENAGGSYHSVYDSFDHYSRFGDPGFHYGVTQAQTAGRVVLRLAAASVLPFEFENFTDTVAGYVHELSELADRLRRQTREHNRRLEEDSWKLAADPRQTYVEPEPLEPVPHLNFAPLRNALESLEAATGRWREARGEPDALEPDQQRRLDQLLLTSERLLSREEGLPGRSWYRHQIYAPGFYTGYGVKTLPGVREAIEQRDWPQAAEQIEVLAEVLRGFAGRLEEIAGIWESAG